MLGDLVEASSDVPTLRDSVALLRTVHRFEAEGSIARLAQLVREGRGEDALAMLREAPNGLVFYPTPDDEPVTGVAFDAVRALTSHEVAVIEAARAGDVVGSLDALDRHRMLCAHRAGPRGVRYWSDAIERWLVADPC